MARSNQQKVQKNCPQLGRSNARRRRPTSGRYFSYGHRFHLSNRADNYGSTENFCYDKLNRLINYAAGGSTCLTGTTSLVKSVAYDDTGNIALKSDLADTSGGTGAYTYANPTNPLPHAVKSISGTANGVKDPHFRYDANGNLTCEYTGPNCSHGAITKETDAYWSFNMAHTIAEGATSLTLTYDSEHARVTQALTTASTTTTTTYLNDPISGAMGEKVATGSTNTWNDYLMVDGKLIGERTCSAPTPTCASGATLQYFVLDHLGSVAVVTDGTGTVLASNGRLSFDAWGKQRNEGGTDDTTCSNGLTSPTTRGFTSQEEIAAFCLINLNARIYDPTIARFMAADTMVPDAYDGQSYNRYTYTDNRPLSFTDPTGHFPGAPICAVGWCWGGDGVAEGDSGVCTVTCDYNGGLRPAADLQYDQPGENESVANNLNGEFAMQIACTDGAACEGTNQRSDEGSNIQQTVSDPRNTEETDAAQNADGAPSNVASSDTGREVKYESTAMSDMDHVKQYLKTGSSADMMDAIYPAMRAFHVDSTGVEYYKVDPSFNDNSYTTPDGDLGIVTFGPPAFRSPGWLGASIAHEFEVHIQQQLMKGQWFESTKDPQGYAMQEVQAYDRIISQQVSRFGLTQDEQVIMKASRDHFYIQLNAQNRALVDSGNYSTHYP